MSFSGWQVKECVQPCIFHYRCKEASKSFSPDTSRWVRAELTARASASAFAPSSASSFSGISLGELSLPSIELHISPILTGNVQICQRRVDGKKSSSYRLSALNTNCIACHGGGGTVSFHHVADSMKGTLTRQVQLHESEVDGQTPADLLCGVRSNGLCCHV